MPHVSDKIDAGASLEREDIFGQSVCEWPNCSNLAVHVVGVVKELGIMSVVCDEHARRAVPKND